MSCVCTLQEGNLPNLQESISDTQEKVRKC